MSARKIGSTDVSQPVSTSSRTARPDIQATAVRLHKSGVEFRSAEAIPTFTEMTVDLDVPQEPGKRMTCKGVVVACDGNHDDGYRVSMLLTGLSAQTQARLNSLAVSP